MESIDFDVNCFLQSGGIYEKTIEDFFYSEMFFLQRESLHVLFFTRFLTKDTSSIFLQKVLFELASNLRSSYARHVSSTVGDLEKRMKSGKTMMVHFENDRNTSRNLCVQKFVNFPPVQQLFDEPQNEELTVSVSAQSRLIFLYLEDFLYKNFWQWLHMKKNLHVTDYIKERVNDEEFEYSTTMLHKVYDITGYICGHRIYNLLHFNRLRSEYVNTFKSYYMNSRLADGHAALMQGLPAECILFREHSQGLYYSKGANFEFIKLVQAIWMQSLSTNVLILFNAYEPVKLVQNVILNSKKVQLYFQNSCVMLKDEFTSVQNLALDENPISYLYRFLIHGFIRVHAKDIYQLRLSNALLSKTGASGIRTNLLSHSASASSTTKHTSNDYSIPDPSHSPSLKCACDKKFKRLFWYKKHIHSCTIYIKSISDSSIVPEVLDAETLILHRLIDLEISNDFSEYPNDQDDIDSTDAEQQLDKEESELDANLFEPIFVNETNDEL